MNPLVQAWDANRFITSVDFAQAVADDLFGLAIENGHVEGFAHWLGQSHDGFSIDGSAGTGSSTHENCRPVGNFFGVY